MIKAGPIHAMLQANLRRQTVVWYLVIHFYRILHNIFKSPNTYNLMNTQNNG